MLYFHHATSSGEAPSKEEEAMYYVFYLEKAFDRVPREVVIWTWRKLGVDEWLMCCCCVPTPFILANGRSPIFLLVVHQPAS